MRKIKSMKILLSIFLLGCFVLLTASKINEPEKIGRPVRVVSLNFYKKSLFEIEKIIDDEGVKGTDIIVLPETWRGQTEPETLEGETISLKNLK
jgi:hypothetical protein